MNTTLKPANQTPEINVVFLGAPTPAHHGPQAALIQSALAQDALRAVYKKLPPGARQNMLLAKRWSLWAVLATEDWALIHGRRTKAPRADEVKTLEVGNKKQEFV